MVLKKLKAIIEENASILYPDITLDTLFKDLYQDSLEEVDLLVKIEEAFRIKIDLRKKYTTVKDIVDYIEQVQND